MGLRGHVRITSGLGVEGDDELTAEFAAWITTHVPIADSQLLVTDWANEVVSLRPRMSVSDVLRLREDDTQSRPKPNGAAPG